MHGKRATKGKKGQGKELKRGVQPCVVRVSDLMNFHVNDGTAQESTLPTGTDGDTAVGDPLSPASP